MNVNIPNQKNIFEVLNKSYESLKTKLQGINFYKLAFFFLFFNVLMGGDGLINSIFFYKQIEPQTLNWSYAIEQSNDIFQYQNFTESIEFDKNYDHRAKMTFRLFVPLIIKFLPFKDKQSIILQILLIEAIFGYLFFLLSFNFLKKWGFEIEQSFLILFSISLTFWGRSFFIDTWGSFDAIAYFLLFLAVIYYENPIQYLFLFLAFWVDERAILISPAICVGNLVLCILKNNQTFSWVFLIKKLVIPFFIVCIYLAFRITLVKKYDFVTFTPESMFNEFFNYIFKFQSLYFPLNLAISFEGLWIFYLALLIYLISQKKYLFSMTLIGLSFPTILSSFLVFDVNKSLFYFFPIIIYCLIISKRIFTEQSFKALLFSCVIICFIIPTTVNLSYLYPTPIKVLKFL